MMILLALGLAVVPETTPTEGANMRGVGIGGKTQGISAGMLVGHC